MEVGFIYQTDSQERSRAEHKVALQELWCILVLGGERFCFCLIFVDQRWNQARCPKSLSNHTCTGYMYVLCTYALQKNVRWSVKQTICTPLTVHLRTSRRQSLGLSECTGGRTGDRHSALKTGCPSSHKAPQAASECVYKLIGPSAIWPPTDSLID